MGFLVGVQIQNSILDRVVLNDLGKILDLSIGDHSETHIFIVTENVCTVC